MIKKPVVIPENMGRGFKANEAQTQYDVDLTDYVDGSTIKYNDEGKLEIIGGTGKGFDTESLEEKQFADDSTIIAVDAEGKAYKAKYKAPLFKDVGVTLELVGSTLNGDTTESTVRVVVTNTMAEEAQGVTLTIGTGGEIDQAAERTLNVAANSNESFTFKVRHNGPTFATATVALDGDTASSNNTASIALPRKAKVVTGESEGVYTEECPLVEATYNGQRLYGSRQTATGGFPDDGDITDYNIITDASTLNGVTINLKGISSLVVYANNSGLDNARDAAGVIKQLTSTDSVETYEVHPIALRGQASDDFAATYFGNTSDYTFDNVSGDLTFTGEAKQAVIVGRPGGANCKYQVWSVSASKRTVTNTKKHAQRELVTDANSKYVKRVPLSTIARGNNDNKYHAYDELNVLVNPVGERHNTNIHLVGVQDETSYKPVGPGLMEVDFWQSQEYYNYLHDAEIELTEKLRIEIPAGEATTFTINGVALPTVRGAINIDSRVDDGLDGVTRITTVTVSSTATATDSVYNPLVDIIIK